MIEQSLQQKALIQKKAYQPLVSYEKEDLNFSQIQKKIQRIGKDNLEYTNEILRLTGNKSTVYSKAKSKLNQLQFVDASSLKKLMDLKQQQILKMSIMPLLADFYYSHMINFIDVQDHIDPITENLIKSAKGTQIIMLVNKLIKQKNMGDKIVQILNNLSLNSVQQMYSSLLRNVLQSCFKTIKQFNYALSPQLFMQLFKNQRCLLTTSFLKFKSIQDELIRNKLSIIQNKSQYINISELVNEQICQTIVQKTREKQSRNISFFSQIDDNLFGLKKLTQSKMQNQRSFIKRYIEDNLTKKIMLNK